MASDPAGLVQGYFQTHEHLSSVYRFNPFR